MCSFEIPNTPNVCRNIQEVHYELNTLMRSTLLIISHSPRSTVQKKIYYGQKVYWTYVICIVPSRCFILLSNFIQILHLLKKNYWFSGKIINSFSLQMFGIQENNLLCQRKILKHLSMRKELNTRSLPH